MQTTSTTLKLSPKFTRPIQRAGYLWVSLGLALFLGNALYQAMPLARLSHEQHIWENGVDAGQAAVRGQKYSRYSFFYEYDFEVIYNDAERNVYHQPLRFSALQSQIPEELAPSVKYDPEDPNQLAVSWGISQAKERLYAVALFGGFWALVASLFFLLGYMKLRQLQSARNALQDPTWVSFAVVEKKPNIYVYEASSISPVQRDSAEKPEPETPIRGARQKRVELLFDTREPGPLLIEGGNKIVALASKKNAAWYVVLREDLYPLEADEEQRRELLQQILLKEQGGGAV
jgi:hypothetical protein